MTEYDERVLDYQKNNHGNYIVKMKNDAKLEDEVKKSLHHASANGRLCIIE